MEVEPEIITETWHVMYQTRLVFVSPGVDVKLELEIRAGTGAGARF